MVGFDGRYKKNSYFFFPSKIADIVAYPYTSIFFFFFFFCAKVVLMRSHNILTFYEESAEIISALSSNPPISEAIV